MLIDNISLNSLCLTLIKINACGVSYCNVQLCSKYGTSLFVRNSEGSSTLRLEAMFLD